MKLLHSSRIQLLASFLLGCSLVTAQLSKKGGYWAHIALDDSLSKSGNSILTYEMPRQDNTALLAEALAEEEAAANAIPRKTISPSDGVIEVSYPIQAPKAAPFKFGKALPISLNISNPSHGQWIENEESKTRLWRFKVHSPGAESISIYFDDFHMTPGSELYVIGKEETFGAFTGELNNKPDRVFGIAPIAGDFLILEYIEPASAKEHSSLVVSHIVHGFRPNPFSSKNSLGTKASSGSCNINVACPEGHGKTDMINAVALLINGKGEAFCTGTMVNNALRDGRQLFLTADHCLGSNSKITNYIAGFGYQMRYCKSNLESMPSVKTVHGMKLLGRSKDTDYAMLEVIEDIPNEWGVYMAGWDATPATSRVGGFFGIHHPSGDVKKVSLYTGTLDLVRLTSVSSGANFWRIRSWSAGVTEPGSSGSALFDDHGYVVGHLYGGDSSCSKSDWPDYYGALSKDWDIAGNPLKKILDPKDFGITRIKGAYLKELTEEPDSDDENEFDVPNDGKVDTHTVTATVTVTDTITSITTTFKATKTETVTQHFTVTKEPVTSTRILTATVTSISTFTRLQPVPTVTKTVTSTVTATSRRFF